MSRIERVIVVVASAACLAVGPSACAQYWGPTYQSSTAAEGAARGMGDVMRAQGERNVNNSIAAGNLASARSQQLDNQLKSTQTYWARREIYDQKMAEESYERAQKREAYFAKTLLKPLDAKDFNATSGAITWPMLCREQVYNDYKTTIDTSFAKLASSGLLSMDEYTEASRTIKAWRDAIQADKANYPTEAVSQALRFLIKLNRELESQLG